jgi:5-methylcytosine-specific restriction endonuclease McrA
MSVGNLFSKTAKTIFLRVSVAQYNNMLARVKRKGYPGLPFGIDGFRMHLLCAMGGNYDGILRCSYCNGFFGVDQIAVDHAIPLSRGGGVDLGNLDFPCMADNDRKGSMTPEEYLRLLEFIDRSIPLAKEDVMHRLRIATKLAAGDRWRKRKQKKEKGLELF